MKQKEVILSQRPHCCFSTGNKLSPRLVRSTEVTDPWLGAAWLARWPAIVVTRSIGNRVLPGSVDAARMSRYVLEYPYVLLRSGRDSTLCQSRTLNAQLSVRALVDQICRRSLTVRLLAVV